MEDKIIQALQSRLKNIDLELGSIPIPTRTSMYSSYHNSCINNRDMFKLFNLYYKEDLDKIKKIKSIFKYCFSNYLRKNFYVDTDKIQKYSDGSSDLIQFFDIEVLSTIYQDYKYKRYKDSNIWLIWEKVIFYSLIFLSMYEENYEENLNIISALAKNFEFTPEELQDYCLAVNTFINGGDIFEVEYQTERAKEFFTIK